MADLITIEQLEARLKVSLSGDDLTQAEAFIADASALARQVAGTDFTDGVGGWTGPVPDGVVPVVVAMVRRAIENPHGLTGERIGEYSYSTAGDAIYATPPESRVIRRAAGLSGVIGVDLDTGLGKPLANEVAP